MRLNIHFLLVLLVGCIAFIGDILIYCLKLNYVASLIIATSVIVLLLTFLISKRKIKISFDFEKTDIFLFVALIFVTIITGIVYPDYIYDVVSYHAYLQKHPFIDKVNFDFFPGRIYCVCLFPLGDRIFYIFRYIFGYRFGTILSFYLPIVLFYQVKRFLNVLNKDTKRSSIWAYGIFLVIIFSTNVGTYYIDNLLICFILEAVITIFSYEKILNNRMILYYISLLFGIAVGIKVTSVFFIIPLVVYLLIVERKNIKSINILDVFVSIFIFMIPFIVYVIDNYIQTGSVLFPYYNSIFKSEYYSYTNWVDERFGIPGIIKKIFWPIIVNLMPLYGDEAAIHDYSWIVGYIFVLGFIFYCIVINRKEIKTKQFKLAIISIVYTVIWIIFLQGYMRYAGIIPIIWVVLIINFLQNYLSDWIHILPDSFKTKKIKNMLFVYIIIMILVIGGICMSSYLDKKNAKYIFKDIERYNEKIHIDGVWGATYDCCEFADLIREDDVPIYGLHKDYYKDSPKALEMWYERILNNDIYVIIDYYGGDFEKCKRVKELKEDDFEIEEIVHVYNADEIPYINTSGEWYLAKVKYVGEVNY